MNFVVSWIVLGFGVPFSFSPWGLLSALFMIPGGSAGYYAVQNAGMAVSQGISSSFKVLIGFIWGLLIFSEPVRSVTGTVAAIVFLILGLIGMSVFAAPKTDRETEVVLPFADDDEEEECAIQYYELSEPLSGRVYSVSNGRLGLLAASFDGLWGGSVLVPIHFADPDSAEGLNFVMSYAIGTLVLAVVVWSLRLLHMSWSCRSFRLGFKNLPSFQVRSIGPYAIASGAIWGAGNIASIASVALLGQAVGYSIVQSSLLLSGLWGVLVFKEVTGWVPILSWFACAVITLIGTVLLATMHVDTATSDPN